MSCARNHHFDPPRHMGQNLGGGAFVHDGQLCIHPSLDGSGAALASAVLSEDVTIRGGETTPDLPVVADAEPAPESAHTPRRGRKTEDE